MRQIPMSLLRALVKRFKDQSALRRSPAEPEAAYDLWAETYDDQPRNLMLYLDDIVFSRLLEHADLQNKIIVDIGCGTGRHWDQILKQKPAELTGWDVSSEMLKRLHQKYPAAKACLLRGNALSEIQDASTDVVISTLTIAHVENLAGAFSEWNRVLKAGGAIIVTDYHPAALVKGADRTFRHQGRLISVRNYVHPIDEVRHLIGKLCWEESEFIELIIDETVRHFYEEQNALDVYRRFYHTPIIYGWRMSKT
jgi:ubiquinone/menaquinone biosynthesis C-methylase UbiE